VTAARLPNTISAHRQGGRGGRVGRRRAPARRAVARAKCRAARDAFCAELSALGVTAYPSQGSYVLARFAGADAARAVDAALRERGVHGRPMAAYHLPDCIRFTVGAADEMAAATKALAEVIDAL